MLTHSEGYFEARERHYQRFLGPINQDIMHSTDVQAVHIDMYQFEPSEERPYWTLITGGMSNERQLDPAECPEYMAPRAEILMYVSKPQRWMFKVLKMLAEMPFTDDTYLHWGHTVQNGKPMTRQPSFLTSYFFLPPFFEPKDFADLSLDGDRVDFLWMIPITEAEHEYAVKHGSRELEKRFRDIRMSRVVDESRQSVV